MKGNLREAGLRPVHDFARTVILREQVELALGEIELRIEGGEKVSRQDSVAVVRHVHWTANHKMRMLGFNGPKLQRCDIDGICVDHSGHGIDLHPGRRLPETELLRQVAGDLAEDTRSVYSEIVVRTVDRHRYDRQAVLSDRHVE